MTKRSLWKVAVTACLVGAGAASAVEAPDPVIPLFDEDLLIGSISGIDFHTNAGIEPIVGAEGIQVRDDPNNSANSISRVKFFIRTFDGATDNEIETIAAFVDTDPYPDPGGGGVTYYCGNDDVGFFAVNPLVEDFPCEFELNAGVATAGATRYVVVSMITYAFYTQGGQDTDISRGSVFVFNPNTGQRIWRNNWPYLNDKDQYLVPGLSAVGDFLNNDGIDELRLVYEEELGNKNSFRYLYFSIVDGSPVKDQTYTVPYP